MKTHNPNCDGDRCQFSTGEVRVLPMGEGANGILCHSCFLYEIRFRKERNRELATDCHFALPSWQDLKPYDAGE